jgi:raffinose/stachyose/melibiose transport system permease protein
MKKKHDAVFWIFLAPLLFSFVLVIAVPFFMGIFYSFTNWSSSAKTSTSFDFVGLKNYFDSLRDPGFIYSFLFTAIYTILNLILLNSTALFFALALTRNIKFRNIYRVGFFIPCLIGGLVLGYVWRFIFNNVFYTIIKNLDAISGEEFSRALVLGRSSTGLLALSIVNTWQYAGYIMMIFIAALESISEELIEAATIDGANKWQMVKMVKIPLMSYAFTITIFLILTSSFKQFDVNYSLTFGGPSILFMEKAIRGTELLSLNLYNTAFTYNNLAMGQAKAVIFFLVLLIISALQVRRSKHKEIEA